MFNNKETGKKHHLKIYTLKIHVSIMYVVVFTSVAKKLISVEVGTAIKSTETTFFNSSGPLE